MRVGIATVQVPFIHGGAENLTEGLLQALRTAGYESDVISMPFRYFPLREVRRAMDIWESENFEDMNGIQMDYVICLKFPAFYLQHPHKITWLVHQHRVVYELWETPFSGNLPKTKEAIQLRQHIIDRDTPALSLCERRYTISQKVSERLLRYNAISSIPLYHPPLLAPRLYSMPAEPYIFFPSRLEELKRQHLLIAAMKYVQAPVCVFLAGDGGQRPLLQQMLHEAGLTSRVRLLGRISDEEMTAYYAHCLGVFFGPYDEDYGYITLEAMLAAKPVITCTDSGGPLEFVVHGETGLVVDPNPEAIGQSINTLFANMRRAEEMGRAGLARYHALQISWEHVIAQLLQR